MLYNFMHCFCLSAAAFPFCFFAVLFHALFLCCISLLWRCRSTWMRNTNTHATRRTSLVTLHVSRDARVTSGRVFGRETVVVWSLHSTRHAQNTFTTKISQTTHVFYLYHVPDIDLLQQPCFCSNFMTLFNTIVTVFLWPLNNPVLVAGCD
jgi:hypothetical protein